MAADFASGSEIVRALAQADAAPGCGAGLRPGGDATLAGPLGNGRAKRALLSSYLRLRGRAAGCLVICGWEGESEAVERRRALSARVLRSGGAAALGGAPGPRLGARALRGPLPARRAARPRLPGGDARDGPHLEPPRPPLRGGQGGDRRRACHPGHPRDRHLPSLTRLPGWRLALLHLPGSPPARRRGRAVARSSRPQPARRSSKLGGRSPTTTPWAVTTLPTCAPRWASWASGSCEPSRSASTRRGS